MGKKLVNRYYLLDRSEWTDSPITKDYQSDHQRTDSLIHSKDTQLRYTHNKDGFSNLKELRNAKDILKEKMSLKQWQRKL